MAVDLSMGVPEGAVMGMILGLSPLVSHRPVTGDRAVAGADDRVEEGAGDSVVEIVAEKPAVDLDSKFSLVRNDPDSRPVVRSQGNRHGQEEERNQERGEPPFRRARHTCDSRNPGREYQ